MVFNFISMVFFHYVTLPPSTKISAHTTRMKLLELYPYFNDTPSLNLFWIKSKQSITTGPIRLSQEKFTQNLNMSFSNLIWIIVQKNVLIGIKWGAMCTVISINNELIGRLIVSEVLKFKPGINTTKRLETYWTNFISTNDVLKRE